MVVREGERRRGRGGWVEEAGRRRRKGRLILRLMRLMLRLMRLILRLMRLILRRAQRFAARSGLEF